MAYFTFPQSYRPLDVLYMQAAIPGSFRRVAALIAISEHTKKDIVSLFPFTKGKVKVTYPAASPRYGRVGDTDGLGEVRDKFGLESPFIFYAGSLSPRKGCEYLLQAYAGLLEKQVPHKLVLTGGWTWGKTDVFHLVEILDLEGRVEILGSVPDEDMPFLYNLADLTVYPSLYEGFGLPVLEAMACGCPVVCSDLTSLPEVAGDAAMMVDPRDVPALTAAMCTSLTDSRARDSMIKKGLARAAAFTWEKTAAQTLQVFESVMS
jgi:glycosyltransferase involved in cell wall biosynthesis